MVNLYWDISGLVELYPELININSLFVKKQLISDNTCEILSPVNRTFNYKSNHNN